MRCVCRARARQVAARHEVRAIEETLPPPARKNARMSSVEAVIFDWGGTLSVWADVDLLDLWQACAERLAPDRVAEVCAQLAAVEPRARDHLLTDQRSSPRPEHL